VQLPKEKIQEINDLMQKGNYKIPDFRNHVTDTGGNFLWLQKNLPAKNKKIDPRLKELLGIV
jgi:hypothetical protein